MSPFRGLPDLVVVGSGIVAGSDLSTEARRHIELADRVLFVAHDAVSRGFLLMLRGDAESLEHLYSPTTPRGETYTAMADRALELLRAGARVCMVFPGHPGIFVKPSHDAIARARLEGYSARMLPAISSLDRLFCDLGVDPAEYGCYNCEAGDFLLFERRPDPTSSLVLWQIGAIGEACNPSSVNRTGLGILRDYLLESYPAGHVVTIYTAVPVPMCEPSIVRVPLRELAEAPVALNATLYVPPSGAAVLSPRMLERLVDCAAEALRAASAAEHVADRA